MSLVCKFNCRKSSTRKKNSKKRIKLNLPKFKKKRRQLSRNWLRSKPRRSLSSRLMSPRWIKNGTCSAEISICLTTQAPCNNGLLSTKKLFTQLMFLKSTPSRFSRKKDSNFQRLPRTIMLQINSDNLRTLKLISIEISTTRSSLPNSSRLLKRRLKTSDTSIQIPSLIQPKRLLEAWHKLLLMRNEPRCKT